MDLDKKEQKDIVKEAFKEWLDEKFTEFGKWTVKSLAAAIFSAILYFLVAHGWLK